MSAKQARAVTAVNGAVAAACYAERGKRWRLGTWPSRPIAIFQRGAPC